jgi:carboxyl-terminal processing protease
VRLTIKRANGQQLTVPVRRAHIPPVTAYYRPLPHHLAYIQIFSFGSGTPGDVEQALKDARSAGSRGIILDLRLNPGGYVDAAQKIVSYFLDRGVVAYEQRSDKSLIPLNVIPGHRIVNTPVAILVDGGTASAAEITAAALRDEDHAVLVGLRTYGKGSMQSVYSLPDGSTVRITDRVWLTPKKASIQTIGLMPNIPVTPGPSLNDGHDRQLQAAQHYLLTVGKS